MTDSRAAALVVFQKLHRDLSSLEEDAPDRAFRGLIVEAVNLLPEYHAEPGPSDNRIILRPAGNADSTGEELNVQETIDALRVIWRDYRGEVEKSN